MRFEEILPALKEGKKIRRNYWWEGHYIKRGYKLVEGEINNQYHAAYGLTIMDLEADDWEIIKEPKKVKLRDLTAEQLNDYCSKLTGHGKNVNGCKQCLFRYVMCFTDSNSSRVYHKDLYSDKFLDQEIEVEEND